VTSKIGGFVPDVGLESISRSQHSGVRLPAQGETELAGAQVRKWLEALFPLDSAEALMRRFVAPQVADLSVLTPARFERLVRESAARLRELEAESDCPELFAARELLDTELALRELLDNYRYLLLKA